MTIQLVPEEVLKKTDKILFIAHLAIGDFTYLQNCFRAFAAAFPHIEMHLWVDEVRRTADQSQWPQLKAYSLYDWVRECGLFARVYTETYSPDLLAKSVREALRERYRLVVSLATLRPRQYAALARELGPKAFVAGMAQKKWWHAIYKRADSKLDAGLPPFQFQGKDDHISDTYAEWFQRLFGMFVPFPERFPYVTIPQQWQDQAREKLGAWGCQRGAEKIIFINPYAKTKKRCWPLDKVAQLIVRLRAEKFPDSFFLINAMPHQLADVQALIAQHGLTRTEAFSAQENFFQLPAMLAQCDLIISVETAVMHLANAVHVPVVALMRQKNPEWVPVDQANSRVITAAKRSDWVDAIEVERVLENV